MYKLSKKRPAAVVGKALKLRTRMPGRRIIPRPSVIKGPRAGVLPSVVRARKFKF